MRARETNTQCLETFMNRMTLRHPTFKKEGFSAYLVACTVPQILPNFKLQPDLVGCHITRKTGNVDQVQRLR